MGPDPAHIAATEADELASLRARIAELEREVQLNRAAQQALRTSEEFNRRIIQTMQGGLVQVSTSGAVTHANVEAQRILNLSYDELTKSYISDYAAVTIHADGSSFPVSEYPVTRCLATGEPQPPVTIGLVRPDGDVVWAVFTAAPLTDLTTGELTGALVTFIDVTAHRRAQLAESMLRRQAAILDQIHDAVIETDLQAVVTMWNYGAQRLYGYSAHEAIGRHVGFLFPPGDAAVLDEQVIAPLLRDGQNETEVRVVCKDGSERIVHASLSLLHDDRGQPHRMIGYSIDITQAKASEEAVRRSAQLQRLMLSELDHRVRNNLASLDALIEITARSKTGGPGSATVAEFAASIRRRVQAMASVHSLLSRGRWFAVKLHDLVQALVPSDLHCALELAGPDILVSPRQVTALGMMLQELVANSLKYGALNQPHGRVRLEWSCEKQLLPGEQTPVQKLKLNWIERGGLPIEAEPRPGQGTRLITGFVQSELGGEVQMRYPRTGADHAFILTLDAVDPRDDV